MNFTAAQNIDVSLGTSGLIFYYNFNDGAGWVPFYRYMRADTATPTYSEMYYNGSTWLAVGGNTDRTIQFTKPDSYYSGWVNFKAFRASTALAPSFDAATATMVNRWN